MNQLPINKSDKRNLLSLKGASKWATQFLKRDVTISNISYLVQYGRIQKFESNGTKLVSIAELKRYYDSNEQEDQWKKKFGKDLNWQLSFIEYRESERTKHVHRIHPYKGKFIPQLVEYFLDSHTDEYKKHAYFKIGDIILDPFCGSGTTLVQSNELGLHAIGIDVSEFNALISNAKVEKHDLALLTTFIRKITDRLKEFQNGKNNFEFEKHLLSELSKFNHEHFPSPEYRRKVRHGEINEYNYSIKYEKEFLDIYDGLIQKYGIQVLQNQDGTFMSEWYLLPVRKEIDFVFGELKKINNNKIKKIIAIILSRAIRSCRATTHADLGTLKKPTTTTYYCKKHGKICKPIFTILGWWQRYTADTLIRLENFEKIKSETFQVCLTGDSRKINIYEEIKQKNPEYGKLLIHQKIKGIFSSPPYVGLINYHEQHAYSYELFGFKRKDDLEIGPLFKGQGKEARASYVKGIVSVLKNCKKYLQDNYDVFLVANDKFNLYPEIADSSNMVIINKFQRPVLNRVEKDRATAYSETIFHLKEK